MNTKIASVRLHVTLGESRIQVDMSTLNAAGHDVEFEGVLAAGKQYLAEFDAIHTAEDGRQEQTRIKGLGGTEPKYGGKSRDQKDDNAGDYPDPGTGPNPGYVIDGPLGFSVGGESWCWNLGCCFKGNVKNMPDGLLTLKGHIPDDEGGFLSTQSVVVRIKKGKAVGIVAD